MFVLPAIFFHMPPENYVKFMKMEYQIALVCKYW